MRLLVRLCMVCSCLAACGSSDYVIVKLTASASLPPVVQVRIAANDGRSQASAAVPSTPDSSGIAFPKTCVVGVPSLGTLDLTAQGMDATGKVVARGATTLAVSSSLQAADVALAPACDTALDCDPAGVCSGAIICGDAGACVAGTNALAPDATGCGDDGGHCYSGNCLPTVCGDGVVEVGEACDLGPQNGASDSTCTATCALASCGDGLLNVDPLPDGGVFQESCDWGTGGVAYDGGNSDTLPNHCREDCQLPRCGDAVVDTGERCDLGPLSPAGDAGNGAGVGCNATCSLLEQVTTVAGTTKGYQDGPGLQAKFFQPWGIAVLGGNAYVADEFNDLIRVIDLDSGVVGTLAGQPSVERTIDGPPLTNALDSPIGITAYAGQLAVAEATDVRVLGLDGTLTTLAGQGSGVPTFVADGPFRDAGFALLQAITWDGTDLFVTDQALGVRRLDLATQTVESYVLETDGGTIFQSTTVAGIVAADAGRLYVADGSSCDLLALQAASGAFSFLAGVSGGCGFVDGTGLQAHFDDPNGICTDGVSVYVADEFNGAVRQIDPLTGAVTTVAGNGTTAGKTVDGVGRAASFSLPVSCAFDPISGDLLVTDLAAQLVRRIH